MEERPTGRDAVPSRRRFLATVGTVGATVGLAGCTLGGASPTGPTVVQIAASTDEESIQPAINDTLHEVGVPSDMTVEILPTTSDIARSQFSQWLSAGLERPSLLRMDSGWTLPFVLRDQVVNLEAELPEVAARLQDEVFEASLATATGPDGELYAVPLFADFGLMLYRKDLIERAGYDPGD